MFQSLAREEQDVTKAALNDQSMLSRNIESVQSRGFASRVDQVFDVSNRQNESI